MADALGTGNDEEGGRRAGTGFEGWAGRLAAAVMARTNRDMEVAAAQFLGPAVDAAVLCLGCGPGEGVAALAGRCPDGSVTGIDPSDTMIRAAARRNRIALGQRRVRLARTTAASLPWPDATFDGATAVNSLQLWEPIGASVAEVARVVRPGGVLVALTHTWAVERHAPTDDWLETVVAALADHSFAEVTTGSARFRSGEAVTVRAHRVPLSGLERGDERRDG